ncbi:acetyltransferase [Maribacter sp. R77961]|uniref:acetyltransferase n=1 Tax=Maribacter sp. R77961 TaxID=3093871 RepID=UPI0037C9A5EF
MNEKENIENPMLIFGASGHAKVVIDIVEKSVAGTIIGLLDNYKPKDAVVFGYKVLGCENVLPEILKKYPTCSILIAVGDNWTRSVIFEKIIKLTPKINFASAIHPSALIGKDVEIGKGVVIMPGAVVNCHSKIGDFTIINTRASIGHEGIMHKFSSLASNVTLGGNVEIGAYSAISISATILHGKKIGTHTIVGASSLITKDCMELSVFYGNPARKIRVRKVGDVYL